MGGMNVVKDRIRDAEHAVWMRFEGRTEWPNAPAWPRSTYPLLRVILRGEA